MTLIFRVEIAVVAVNVTGCYGDGLYDSNNESSQWLCDHCVCGNFSDVRINAVVALWLLCK